MIKKRRLFYTHKLVLYTFLVVFIIHIQYEFVEAYTSIAGGPLLLYATSHDIRIANISRQGKITTIVKGLEDATAVDFYYKGQLICWSHLEMIQCVPYNGTYTGKEISVGTNRSILARGIAVDWYTEKIYWTDGETNRIEVATIDDRLRKVLFWSDIDQPRAIFLVPMKGLMFWTDWGEISKIERAGMDGDPSSRRVITKDEIFWPNGLTVDYDAEKVYWFDAKLKFIAVMDYDGLNRRHIVSRGLVYPFALTLFNQKLYWTDWKSWAIYSYDIQTNTSIKELIRSELVPMDIRAYSAHRQPPPLHNYPCSVNNANCSHLCLLSSEPPGFTCACPTGVKLLEGSGTKCTNGPMSVLIIVQRMALYRVSLDTPDYTLFKLPLHGIKHAISVDYDKNEEFLYWSDDEVRSILRAKIDGSERTTVIQGELWTPDGLALDTVAGNIYWTDTHSDTISVARLNGSSSKVIIYEDLLEPRAIALAPSLGWMFWTDWHETRPKIERASLDGSERVLLVSKKIEWPNGIALDVKARKLYWGDARTHKLEVCNMDGSDRRELLTDNLYHLFGLTILGDYLYWTDWQRRTLERVNKNTGTEREVIVESLASMMGLKAFTVGPESNALENDLAANNSCARNNGDCSHLCFNRPADYACGCPLGLELSHDKRNCIEPAAYLLYARKNNIGRISIENEKSDTILPIKGVKDVSAIAIHISESKLYWSDSKSKSINRCSANGSYAEKLIEWTGIVEGLAVDWAGQNLYWTDSTAQRIEVARLDGSSRRVLIWQGLKKPKSIALDPKKGYMYWSEWGSKCIKKAGMDGSGASIILDQIGRASALTIDYERRALYWVTLDPPAIEMSALDGSNRRPLLTENVAMPNALAIYQNNIYWGDWNTGDIEFAVKYDGSNRTRIHRHLDYLTDMAVFHRSRQAGTNQCASDNGGCSHLCLATPTGGPADYHCACPTHYHLNDDNLTCSAPSEFLMFAQRNASGRVMVGAGDCPDAFFPLTGLRNIRSIDYDPVKGTLYWIDGRNLSIRRAALLTAGHSSPGAVVVAGRPFALALDVLGRALYWTSAETDAINATAIDNATAAGGVVLRGEGMMPRHIAIHQSKRLIVWTDIGLGCIMRAAMDGSLRTELTRMSNATSALTVDLKTDTVYWAAVRQIHAIDIEGKNKRIVWQGGTANSLAAYGGSLYWPDAERQLMRLSLAKANNPANPVPHVVHVTDIVSVYKVDTSHPCYGGLACDGRVGACLAGGACVCGAGCARAPPACGPHHYTCAAADVQASVDCIPSTWRCDGQADCPDGSDEESCAPCGARVRCADTRCADSLTACDAGALCDATCCGERDAFRCPGTRLCLAARLLCDGRAQCQDGADEAECARAAPEPRAPAVVGALVASGAVLLLACAVYRRRRVNAARRNRERTTDALGPEIRLYPCKSTVGSQWSSASRGRPAGASSSASSGHYPREPLNPPPSPASTRRAPRHYRAVRPPPPTPASTDAADESDCNAAPPPTPVLPSPPSPSSRCSAYHSPYPPPPSPVPHFADS